MSTTHPHDPVNHPRHYTEHTSGIEVIRYTRLLPFGPGNAVKYVMRRDHKDDPVQNIEKAIWYLTDSIENNVRYSITSKMINLIKHVIAAEPNDLVIQFLSALYLPRNGGGIFAQISPEPDYDLARETLEVLLQRYLVPEAPC